MSSTKVPSQVQAIYCESYAAIYPSLYISPWLKKHQLNAENLTNILNRLSNPSPRWLDMACGQAWHFSLFPGRARMLGLDISESQLVRARVNAPEAILVCADLMGATFPVASFDLVTNFWAGYCYLGSSERIAKLLHSAVDWIAPGGALYIEVLLGRDLESFNRSRFSSRTGFVVSPRSRDYSEWEYEDIGGRHIMISPPVEEFLDIVTPSFRVVDARHDGAFMIHLIATGRR
jgi:SAM-dependent methyltransferase